MASIPKTYANEVLKQYGLEYVNKDARIAFIKQVDKYAAELSKNTNKAVQIRRGKKILPKDVELAIEHM